MQTTVIAHNLCNSPILLRNSGTWGQMLHFVREMIIELVNKHYLASGLSIKKPFSIVFSKLVTPKSAYIN